MVMTLTDLLNQQRIEDAIVSLAEARVPLIVGDLDFHAGTWKGLPIHPKEAGQLADIVDSLSKNDEVVLKWSALLVNWGRNYEVARLLRTTSLGNLSSATAVYDDDAPHGDSSNDDEWSDNNTN